jgi:hypothetical protein
MDDSGCSDLTECLVADTIGILTSYINQIEKLHPRIAALPQSTAPTSGDDSQGSLGISVDVDRQVMIFVSCERPFQYSSYTNVTSRYQKKSYHVSAN